MTNQLEQSSLQRLARTAGVLYLGMMPFAALYLYAVFGVAVPGDAAATAENLASSETLYRLGIASWMVAQTISMLMALTLYRLLRTVDHPRAMLMLAFALMGVAISFAIEGNHLAALLLLSGADYLSPFDADQLQAHAMLFLELRRVSTYIPQIFWGIWLFPLGFLVYKSRWWPRVLGILLIVAGFGYVFDSATHLVVPDFEVALAPFLFVGEIAFALWLLIRGVNLGNEEARLDIAGKQPRSSCPH